MSDLFYNGVIVKKYQDGKIEYTDPYKYTKHLKPLINRSNGLYSLPANLDTLRVLKEYGGKFYEMDEDFDALTHQMQVMMKYKVKANDLTKEFIDALEIPSELNWLRDYQKVDAVLSSKRKYFANLNTMRSGKTPTTCASLHLRYLNEEKSPKVIISILQSTANQWIREIVKACPEYKIIDITKADKNKRLDLWNTFLDADEPIILLVNREKLSKDVQYKSTDLATDKLISRDRIVKTTYGLITDESHFLRNRGTVLSEVHFFLSKYAYFRIALTGTKIANKGTDLYGLFKYLQPDKYTNYWNFVDRYFVEEKGYASRGVSFKKFEMFDPNTKDELSRLLYMNSIERQKDEVMPYLPQYEKLEPIILDLDKEDAKNYLTLYGTYEYDENEVFFSAASFIALRTKLLQASSMPNRVFNTKSLGVKEKWLYEWLENNPEAKPIIFGRFTNTTLIPLAENLRKKGYKVGMIIGETKDKGAVADEWQNGKLDILICNTVSGGTGLTLDYADTVIFFERDDNQANNRQAEERITATSANDQRGKQIINVLVNDSMEMIQYAQQENKIAWVKEMLPERLFKRLNRIYKGGE